jgi:L-xylulokinase
MSVVAGTWSIATVVTPQPLIDRTLLMTTAFADARRWMAIEASATSAANLNWFATEAFVIAAQRTSTLLPVSWGCEYRK